MPAFTKNHYVDVTGQTLNEIRQKIEDFNSKFFDNPEIHLALFSEVVGYRTVYYAIVYDKTGEQIQGALDPDVLRVTLDTLFQTVEATRNK